MKKRLVLLIVLLGATLTGLAQTAGQNLYQACKQAVRLYDHQELNSDHAYTAATCIGFVAGVQEADVSWRRVDESQGNISRRQYHFCAPEDSTIEQSVRAVLAWMDAHPDAASLRGVAIVGKALVEAYPCH